MRDGPERQAPNRDFWQLLPQTILLSPLYKEKREKRKDS